MIFHYILLPFTFILLPFTFLYSQAAHFSTILTEQGQAIKQVRTMFQDSKGYLWIGSSGGGICRYDGKYYVIYTRKDGLCSDDVNCVAEDADGAIWFGTAGGVSKFINGKFINFPEEAELNKSSVFSIVKDKENNLWFGTSSGAYKFSGNTYQRFSEKNGLTNSFIRSILCDRNGKLWFGTVNGKIFLYENNFFKETEVIVKNKDFISAERLDVSENAGEADEISNNLIWSMCEDGKGNFWIGVDDGLWKGKTENGKWKIERTELSGNSFLSICEDKKGNMWFGTGETGIWKYDGKTFTNFDETDGLASNLIYSILCDREGNMWFGGYGNGVSKLSMLSYEIYNKQRKFPQSFVWTVKEDFDGNIWAGFYQPGISVIVNPHEQNKKEVRHFPTEGLVYYIFFENETTLWAATVNGIEIFKWNKSQKTVKPLRKIDKRNGLPGNIVRYIYKDERNNLWVATAFGVAFMEKKKGQYDITQTFTNKDGLVNNYVFCVLEDNEKNIWFATAGGVSRLNAEKKKFTNYLAFPNKEDTSKQKSMLLVPAVSEGLANHDVRSIVKDNEGMLWFATGAGLSFYDKQTDNFKSITSKDGLSIDRLYFLEYDNTRNALWIGTAFGLDKMDLNEYKKNRKIIFSHPTAYNGFMEVETNTNAVCIDRAGKLWFGSIDGLIRYLPDHMREMNPVEPLTHITQININRKDTLLKENAALPYEQNNIALHFAGISLSMPERVRYRYMLTGFDNDWSPLQKETFANYSNLHPGNYTFKVLASNNDGVWNTIPAQFSFSVLPPWWQTWWFRIIGVVFIITVVFLYIKWRERNLQKERDVLEEKVKERTKELATQKEMVEDKNKEITDSILCAKRIQTAMLTSEKYLKENIPGHFIFFKPKDIVSGDFYWSHCNADFQSEHENMEHKSVLLALADCTGHGVPGAMMSMIGINKLNEIVKEKKIIQPGQILNQLREEIILALNPDEKDGAIEKRSVITDGMDVALICLRAEDESSNTEDTGLQPATGNRQPGIRLDYAGANNPLYIVRKEFPVSSPEGPGVKLIELMPNHFPVGKHIGELKPFMQQTIAVQKGDMIYLFSDGFADQFGGPKGKKFRYSRFKELLLSIYNKSVDEQGNIIADEFDGWKKDLIQVDDVSVIGIRV